MTATVHEYLPSRETLARMLSFKRGNIFEDDQATVGAVFFCAYLTINRGYLGGRKGKVRKRSDGFTW